MSTIKNTTTEATPATHARMNTDAKGLKGLPFLFDKQNYMLMAIGLVVIILGYALMVGGKSADPNVFNEAEIYSFRRITLAPIMVLIGLAIEGYAIMKRSK